jgi:CRISPR system Cascade subunit CasE
MFLHQLFVNPRNRGARGDLSDPYEMHSTLSRAFAAPEQPLPPGAMLWRLEDFKVGSGLPQLLVQSGKLAPDWTGLFRNGWLGKEPAPPLDLSARFAKNLKPGALFRFRLRANPSVCRNRKRLALRTRPEQEAWLIRVAAVNGFAVPRSPAFHDDREDGGLNVMITREEMLFGRRRNAAAAIKIFAALFEGYLRVDSPELFVKALAAGIGHGKALGLGLLSVAPLAGGPHEPS